MTRTRQRALGLVIAACGSFLLSSPTQADPALAPTQPAGWNEFVEALRTLPSQLLAKLPEDQRGDPQVQQEVARLALESLASSTLSALGPDGDHPVFLPMIGQVMNIGQPNADTIYRTTYITPGGIYRLRGRIGSLPIARIAEAGPSLSSDPKHIGAAYGQYDLRDLHPDAEGRFDVILSLKRPAGHTGDWWQLNPATNRLVVRLVSADWAKQQDPTLSIERLDAPTGRPRVPAAELERRLRGLPMATSMMASLLVDHAENLRQQGVVNTIKVFDVVGQFGGGVAGQFYYEGAYDLRDDEALLIEAKVPKTCGYRSMILTNDIYETIDWTNNQSSLNGAQSEPDKDGVLRVVVSAKDPGVPNWLDTAGYPRGVVQGRWTDCDSNPVPSARKVALADLRNLLPADTPTVTPQERDRIVRDRRAAFQQRPLW